MLPGALVAGQRRVGRHVDLIEVVGTDEAIDGQPTGPPQVDEPGDDRLRHAVALDQAAQGASGGEQAVDVERLLGARRRGADARELETPGPHVDGDDRLAAADDAPMTAERPKRPAPEDGDRRAGLRAQRVDDAAGAGLDGAAKRATTSNGMSSAMATTLP
jgi:hypothetical protein